MEIKQYNIKVKNSVPERIWNYIKADFKKTSVFTFSLLIGAIILMVLVTASELTGVPGESKLNPIVDKICVGINIAYNNLLINDDPIIKEKAELCRNSTEKAKCVFDIVPYTYDWNRVGWKFEYPLIMTVTPDKYFSSNGSGICRDNAVMTKAVLDNLGIKSEFVCRTQHIYVIAYENNNTYELNGNFRRIN